MKKKQHYSKTMKPIVAEDFDGPPGFYFDVCPSCKCMIDYLETPCRYCGQELDWSDYKEKAAQS